MAQIGFDHGRRRDRLAGRSLRDGLAVAEDQHLVAQRGDHVHVVLDQQDGNATLVARIEDVAREVFLLLLVHAGHRLIEDQELRLRGEGARQFNALLQARRDRLDRFVADVLQLHEIDDLLDDAAVRRFLARRPDPVAQRGQRARAHVDVATEQDVVEHAHAAKECEVLEGARHGLLRDAVGPHAGDVLAEEVHAACLRRVEAGNDVDHGRLAAAVRAHEPEDLALANGEAHALERLQAAKRAFDALAFEDHRAPGFRCAHAVSVPVSAVSGRDCLSRARFSFEDFQQPSAGFGSR